MAEVTAAVGAPRVAAIEHPLSQTVGRPGDAAGQMDVLWATLQAFESLDGPGQTEHLPFVWPEPRSEAIKHSQPLTPAPIEGYLKRKPWNMVKFLRGEVPGS